MCFCAYCDGCTAVRTVVHCYPQGPLGRIWPPWGGCIHTACDQGCGCLLHCGMWQGITAWLHAGAVCCIWLHGRMTLLSVASGCVLHGGHVLHGIVACCMALLHAAWH